MSKIIGGLSMQPQEQYLKYKPEFKKLVLLKAAMNALMFVTLLLFFFLPCFRIQPETAELADASINFSLLDEIMHLLPFATGTPNATTVILLPQIFAVAFFAAGLIAIGIDFVKSTIGCFNPDNYTIIEYDKIKSKTDKKTFRRFSPSNLFFIAILYEGCAIAFSKIFIGSFGEMQLGSLAEINLSTEVIYADYFAAMNTVAWGFWIVLIFLIADIALAVLSAKIGNKLKVQILKEDYAATDAPAK